MDIAGIISVVWILGSIGACVVGCRRSYVLGRKIRELDDKIEKLRPVPVVYNPQATAPAYMPLYSDPKIYS